MVCNQIRYWRGKAIPQEWTLEMIRTEIERLDKMTGLRGADIPCVFNSRMPYLGRFCMGAPGAQEADMRFEFNPSFFRDTSGRVGAEVSKADTVAHEYAHYYSLMKYNYRGGHGRPWKRACSIIGCHPSSYEDKQVMQELEKRSAPYTSKFKVGASIKHPVFGSGKILKISTYHDTAVLLVSFDNDACRKIDELWLLRNQRR